MIFSVVRSSLAKKLKDELNCELVCVDAPHLLPRTSTVVIDGVTVLALG